MRDPPTKHGGGRSRASSSISVRIVVSILAFSISFIVGSASASPTSGFDRGSLQRTRAAFLFPSIPNALLHRRIDSRAACTSLPLRSPSVLSSKRESGRVRQIFFSSLRGSSSNQLADDVEENFTTTFQGKKREFPMRNEKCVFLGRRSTGLLSAYGNHRSSTMTIVSKQARSCEA